MYTRPCGKHKREVCRCGNVLFECDCKSDVQRIRVNHQVCRCENPGPGRRAQLSTTNKGYVKTTMDDIENNLAREERYSGQKRYQSHLARQRKLGGRVIYDG